MARRRRSFLKFVDVLYVCSFCLLTILAGNILLLYHSFHRNSPEEEIYVSKYSDQYDREEYNQINNPHGRQLEDAGAYRGYENFGSRLRKLMENVGESSHAPPLFDIGLDLAKLANISSKELFTCADIDRIEERSYIASGWTKAVYRGKIGDKYVAVKTVDIEGQDVRTCLRAGGTIDQCYRKAAKKIIKEFFVLNALSHGNLVKVLGFCFPDDNARDNPPFIAMVTELGETVDLIKILQMSWEDRLKISYDVTKLVDFLAKTPYGSTSMNDFRRQQFVLVGDEMKLSDVDDVGFGDPRCSTDDDCTIVFSSANFTQRLPCVNSVCEHYNEKRNAYNAGRHFTTFLLPHGAPHKLRPFVDKVVDAFSNLTMSSSDLLVHIQKIVDLYRNGFYLTRSKVDDTQSAYTMLRHRDLPQQYDYKCSFSVSGDACAVSVFDIREAEDLCDADDQCRGFVMSDDVTWAGRRIAHFKNGFGSASRNDGTSVYMKPAKPRGR